MVLLTRIQGKSCDIWPVSHEKGPSDITNSTDPDQPLQDIKILKTVIRNPIVKMARNIYVTLL